ncbi:MAG: AAA family ATPase [Halieaceae bacterium]|nr:AAA family ATPase [Halieaceae bacterium]
MGLRALPSAPEAERGLLGGLLRDHHRLPDMAAIVRPSDFYTPHHGALFGLMIDMMHRGEHIDAITLPMRVSHEPSVGLSPGYVVELSGACPSVEALPHYAEQVRATAQARAVIRVLTETADAAYQFDDAAMLIDGLLHELTGIAPGGGPKVKAEAIADTVDEHLEQLRELAERGESPGVSTGIGALDRRMGGGFRRKTLTILAARPGMAKTALAMNIALNVAGRGEFVGVCQMEGSRELWMDRALARLGEVDLGLISDPQRLTIMDWDRLDHARAAIKRRHLQLVDGHGQTPASVRSLCLRWQMQHGPLSLLVVDYLGLFPDVGANRVQSLGHHCKAMLGIAKEFDCPVLLLHQLSRAVEQRPDKRPLLADLRDSGQIEEDADNVIMLYREHYYKRETADPNHAEVLIRKQRQGQLGPVPLRWVGKFQAFGEVSDVQRRYGAT